MNCDFASVSNNTNSACRNKGILVFENNPPIQSMLHKVFECYGIEEFGAFLRSKWVPYTVLKHCEALDSTVDLRTTLKASNIVFPVEKLNEKSEFNQKMLESIQKQMENQEYLTLIESIPGFSNIGEPIENTDRRAILGMANVMYTAISVFVAVFWIGGAISATLGWRVLVAMALASVVLFSETFLAYRSFDVKTKL